MRALQSVEHVRMCRDKYCAPGHHTYICACTYATYAYAKCCTPGAYPTPTRAPALVLGVGVGLAMNPSRTPPRARTPTPHLLHLEREHLPHTYRGGTTDHSFSVRSRPTCTPSG